MASIEDFEIGDRVRVLHDSDGNREHGEEGVVYDKSVYYVDVRFDTEDPQLRMENPFYPTEIVKIEDVTTGDAVNHPSHYNAYGAEVIEIVEHLNFNRGSAVKYITRAGLKDPNKELEDLEKALWCLNREIARVKKEVDL